MKLQTRNKLLALARERQIQVTPRDGYVGKQEGADPAPTAAVVVETEAEADVIGRLYAERISRADRLRADETRAGVVLY